MGKVLKFEKMIVIIPLKDGETKDEIEDRLADTLIDSVGAEFVSYTLSEEEEEDEE